MCYLWCCVYCLLTVCVQYSFNNQLCVSNVNYVRHYDVLRQYYVDCMYTLFVLYPTATLRVGDTKLHDYPKNYLYVPYSNLYCGVSVIYCHCQIQLLSKTSRHVS